MALSGTFTKAVGNYNRLRLTWSATQNQAGNYSTITTNLYWEALNNGGNISSSASKTATTTLGGTARSDSFTASLAVNGSKLIQTETWTVYHNASGVGSTTVKFSAVLGLTIGGVSYGTVTSDTYTITLDTIQTRSTIKSKAFTVPQDVDYYITSANSTNYHLVELILSYGGATQVVASRGSAYGGSWRSFSLTVEEMKKIVNFTRRNSSTFSVNFQVRVTTYLAGTATQVGTPYTSEKYTVSVPSASTATTSKSSYNLNETISYTLDRANSNFVHMVELASSATYGEGTILQQTNIGTGSTINLSNYDVAISNAIGNNPSGTFYLRVHTFYNSQVSIGEVSDNKIRLMTVTSFTVNASAPPVFSGSSITYKDLVSTTTAITGSNQVLVKGHSTAEVTIPSNLRAAGQMGATIVSYSLSLGSFSQTYAPNSVPSKVSIDITTLSSTTNLVFTAIDNRGNKAEVTYPITIYDYQDLKINLKSGERQSTTTNVLLKISGTFSKLNGTNWVTSAYYGLSSTSVTTPMTIQFNTSTGSWEATAQVTQSDTDSKTYYFTATDKFQRVVTASITVGATAPILFIHSDNESVGIGKIPSSGYKLDVEGKLRAVEVDAPIKTTNKRHLIEATTSQTSPLLEIKTKHASSPGLLLNASTASETARIGFASAGSIHGYLEKKASTNAIELQGSNGVNLVSPVKVLASTPILEASTKIISPEVYLEKLTSSNYKIGNSSNMVGINSTANGQFLIQQVVVTVTDWKGASAKDTPLTWPRAFLSAPEWIVATSINSNSYNYLPSIYSPSTTGAILWLAHINNVAQTTSSIQVRVVACGRI